MRGPASWASYRDSIGDRSGLFAALVSGWAVRRALYPGSYLDLAPSVAIHDVTYVDVDRRAARYFADHELVRSELASHGVVDGAADGGAEVSFLSADYTRPLPLPPAAFDLLISLYAGPVWDHCRRHLRPEGLLLANASHGDAGIAALDPDLRLVAAVHERAGHYRLDTEHLGQYLVPRNPAAADPAAIRRSGRGIAYTRTAFAYLFALR